MMSRSFAMASRTDLQVMLPRDRMKLPKTSPLELRGDVVGREAEVEFGGREEMACDRDSGY